MQKTTMLATAIAALVMASGTAMMPAQAVDPDCTHDYVIPDVEPDERTLTTLINEVGRIIVDDTGDVTVTVSLETEEDMLLFGVFYLNGISCDDAEAAGFSTCTDEEQLDSDPDPVSKNCVLDAAPSNGQRAYYFNFVNGGDSTLGYKAWEI